MPILPDREKPPAETLTPGIEKYEINTYEERGRQWVQLQTVLSKSYNQHWQHGDAFEMLRVKAANAPLPFVQESEFYLPENTTISLEVELGRHILETNEKRVKKCKRRKQYFDFGKHLTGYFLDFERPDGSRELKTVRFLPNGVRILLWSSQEKRGLRPRWSPLSAEVSVGISKRLSEEEAREHLEAFAHTPY